MKGIGGGGGGGGGSDEPNLGRGGGGGGTHTLCRLLISGRVGRCVGGDGR